MLLVVVVVVVVVGQKYQYYANRSSCISEIALALALKSVNFAYGFVTFLQTPFIAYMDISIDEHDNDYMIN